MPRSIQGSNSAYKVLSGLFKVYETSSVQNMCKKTPGNSKPTYTEAIGHTDTIKTHKSGFLYTARGRSSVKTNESIRKMEKVRFLSTSTNKVNTSSTAKSENAEFEKFLLDNIEENFEEKYLQLNQGRDELINAQLSVDENPNSDQSESLGVSEELERIESLSPGDKFKRELILSLLYLWEHGKNMDTEKIIESLVNKAEIKNLEGDLNRASRRAKAYFRNYEDIDLGYRISLKDFSIKKAKKDEADVEFEQIVRSVFSSAEQKYVYENIDKIASGIEEKAILKLNKGLDINMLLPNEYRENMAKTTSGSNDALDEIDPTRLSQNELKNLITYKMVEFLRKFPG